MKRSVTAYLQLDVEGPTRMAMQVAAAGASSTPREQERVSITLNGHDLSYRELAAAHGGRMWLVMCDTGRVTVEYAAQVDAQQPASSPEPDAIDSLVYLRPSRYCESDRLIGFAANEFRGIDHPADILTAVSSWVGSRLDYIPGSSGPTDGAVDTLLAGRGVCRDFAHLTVALLRALEIPSRTVAVYAPGLTPMDFHAVAEAYVDGHWYVVDSTLLAPRASLLRIATGRDAADTAFLSIYGGQVNVQSVAVTATTEASLPAEDVTELVTLG